MVPPEHEMAVLLEFFVVRMLHIWHQPVRLARVREAAATVRAPAAALLTRC